MTMLCCKERKNILKESHISKYVALLRGMPCVNNIAFCAGILVKKRGTAPLRRRLDMWKCRLCSFKGHVISFTETLHILYGYCPCKNTLHCSKGRLHLFKRVCCISVLNIACICWKAWVY